MDNRKIGDYVHYHLKNYQERGINRTERGPQFNWSSYKQTILNNLKDFANKDNEIEEIENNLNKIMSGRSNTEINDSIIKEIWQIVKEELQQEFGDTLGNITDFGDIEKVTNSSIKSQTENTLNKITPKASSVKVSTILKRLTAIEMAINSLQDKKKKSDISKAVKDIYKDLSSISDLSEEILKSRETPQINSLIERTKKVNNIIEKVNTLVKACATTPALNLQKGELFEYVIALMPAIAHNELSKGFKEHLLSTKIGDERTEVEINLGNFSDEINLEGLSTRGYKIDEDTKTMVSFIASQGKVDVNLQWGDSYIPISAKNVNLNSSFGVHILSGSSLLYLLQDENPEAITHYLNIIAEHPDGSLNLPAAHNTIKIIILYKALSGATYKRDSAELFIVNDNKTGKVRVYDITQLVKKASEDLEKYTNITANGHNLEGVKLANNYSDKGYSQRITGLIKDMHAQKISVALKTSLFS